MRGIAALLVVLYHYYFAVFSERFPNVFVAVDFFFILSGFVVCHAYADKLRGGMRAVDYMARRVTRLFPMMALGIALGAPIFYAATIVGRADYSKFEVALSTIMNLCFLPYLNEHSVFTAHGLSQGNIFPADTPLWSIFFEMVASVSFIWLARAERVTLMRLCAGLFLMVLAFSVYGGIGGHTMTLEPDAGHKTGDFLGGFPRVLYGFICGMILCELRRTPSVHSWLKRLQMIEPPGAGWLYLALAAIMLFPLKLGGGYYFLTIGILAPLLVLLGANAVCDNQMALVLSERLGWLSYPVYCLHEPVHRAVKALRRIFTWKARAAPAN